MAQLRLKLEDFVLGHRIAMQRMLIVGIFAYAYWSLGRPHGAWVELAELVGDALLCATMLGRIWCLMFIGGHKNARLIMEGPYSVVRHPLYLLNLGGAVGFGLAVQQPMLALVLALGLGAYQSVVARHEEASLLRTFGEAYQRYQASTPRWIPRWSQYTEPGVIDLNTYRVRRGLLDSGWWLWGMLSWELVEYLRNVT